LGRNFESLFFIDVTPGKSEVPGSGRMLTFLKFTIAGFCILLFCNSPGYASGPVNRELALNMFQDEQAPDQEPGPVNDATDAGEPSPVDEREISGRDIQRGQRLFHGLLPLGLMLLHVRRATTPSGQTPSAGILRPLKSQLFTKQNGRRSGRSGIGSGFTQDG
jgi:hypothetical protein